MRGILKDVFSNALEERISPAHAGNTGNTLALAGAREDQPRTCGEYPGCGLFTGLILGSAPHMRGILWLLGSGGGEGRISPAHAGNTRSRVADQVRVRDQPRTCGEYWEYVPDRSRSDGSAPHMRGIL